MSILCCFLITFVDFDILCNLAGKFPTLVTHQETLESKVNESKAMVKFQLKKELCMGVAVGNVNMEEKQIFQNVQLSVNFLVSLLKKNWQNMSSSPHSIFLKLFGFGAFFFIMLFLKLYVLVAVYAYHV
ncbi:hypothetical protein GLYMA_19G029750v4 [Glycine max]|nr:hypothetical protein GLYMA_19G029750v4 [Glycine max]KAH1076185.1 hypothetical protein GYH30_051880 [Glycine max]